jgi:hypothetical protein
MRTNIQGINTVKEAAQLIRAGQINKFIDFAANMPASDIGTRNSSSISSSCSKKYISSML